MPRPTDYRPEYDQMLIDHMAKGFSFESFAGVAGCAKKVLYDWVKANASFRDAKEVGIERCRIFWEQKGIDAVNGKVNIEMTEEQEELARKIGSWPTPPKFNASVWIFNMKNRFKDEWKDRQQLEHSGPDGGAIPIETTPAQLKDMLKDPEGIAALETVIKKLGTK